jgi:uncharacterized membrane protein HdeD (DUF308 family)
MNKQKKASIISMIIGVVGIAFGLYGAFTQAEFQNYFMSLFLGATLFGTGYIQYTDEKEIF